MRKKFFELLHNHMYINKDIYFLTGGLGYGGIEKIKKDYPNRFFNFEAMEQCMVTSACAIALEGKIPIVYSITPFLLRTSYETLKIYVNDEKIPIKLVGSGRNKDYFVDNRSHWADDAKNILNNLSNIIQWFPEEKDLNYFNFESFININKPQFLSLKR